MNESAFEILLWVASQPRSMSLTEEMAEDLARIETLAESAENDLQNGNSEQAEERLEEIRELAHSWQ